MSSVAPDRFARNWPLLRSVIRRDGGLRAAIDDRGEDDIAGFCEFVHVNHLREPWHAALTAEDAATAIPRKQFGRLERYMERRRRRSGELIDLLGEVVQRLDGAGVGVMLLKGPHYASRFYGGPAMRQYDDLDVLVRPRDLDRATRVLSELGFEQVGRRPVLESAVRHFEHAILLQRDGDKLDLHWAIRTRPGFRLDGERLWRQARPFEIRGLRCLVPSDEDILLSIALGIAEDLEQGGVKLKPFCDLYRAVEAIGPDLSWPAFFDARRDDGTLLLVVNVMTVFGRLFDAESEIPALGAALARHRGLVAADSADRAMELVAAPRGAPIGRVWFARCIDCNPIRYHAWQGLAFVFARSFPNRVPRGATVRAVLSSLLRPGRGGRTR
jgi:hypothetical protein